ncbi:unnamed protein product [Brachionus calyciflorus]|uniref:BUD13 homolog n=1 Tax=Brachionus calyciflorus TaxID=104777 RepID=A0A813SAL0_9BILA|nr:unnamed protein product [Brachionus calyciflorus]
MQDYLEKPKKKKKRDKDDQALKARPVRNFQIIDDDININDLKTNDESEIMVDLLDPEGPSIVYDIIPKEKPKDDGRSKWVKLDFFDNEDSNHSDKIIEQETKSLFRKRGEKNATKASRDSDDDLDTIPRKRNSHGDLSPIRRKAGKSDEDSDLDIVPRRRKKADDDFSLVRKNNKHFNDSDEDLDLVRRPQIKKEKLSPNRKNSAKRTESDSDLDVERGPRLSKQKQREPVSDVKNNEIDETKVRVRKLTKEEEAKKAKEAALKAKYAEWGKGLVQKKEREEKIKEFLHESEKPLARFADDRDLDVLLKNQEREDDPMLAYMRKNKEDELKEGEKPKPKYRGPPAPPNRYNILPGSKWDGVDRSNGFEKKYYESITAKKVFEQEAYKWSTEDM